MNIANLEQDNVTGYYDEEKRILFVTYRGTLTPAATAAVYTWIGCLLNVYGVAHARGSIYDFREVTNFMVGNLTAAQNQSYQLNEQFDLRAHPVALLVNNIYQRAMVKAALNVTPQQDRKRLVHSMEGALAFIEQWHEQLSLEG
jgi:hypothetical protein